MAIKSMTGFGRGEFEKDGRVWTAEVRCVNNRYLDLKMKFPRGYTSLEEKIRKKVAETLSAWQGRFVSFCEWRFF